MSDIKNKLDHIFYVVLKIAKSKNKKNLNFKNVKKWDSLNHIKLIMALESKFQISIDPDEALRLLSFKDIVKFINKNKN